MANTLDAERTTTTVHANAAAAAAKPAREAPSGIDLLPVAHELAYTWEYASQRMDLRTLYEKSKDLMWNARFELPWDTDVDPTRGTLPDTMNPIYKSSVWAKLDPKTEIPELRRQQVAFLYSNFLHGEQGALLATAQLVELAPSLDAKLYAAAQVFDEARHVEAYDRYLREKVELVYPIGRYLRELLDAILSDPRWDVKFLGMQIVVEGMALGAAGLIQQMANEPLIKKITQYVHQDESRHVAFGLMSLKERFAELSSAELREREDFVIHAAKLLYGRMLGTEVYERLGFPVAECEAAAAESDSIKLFRKLSFSKIVPNIKRLGLLTPYVRAAFAELDILEYENWEATA